MKTFNYSIFLSFCVMILIGFASCKHDPISSDIDWELYEMAQETEGFTWYKNNATPLIKSTGSGHSYPKLRTRYNNVASQFLDSNGQVIDNSKFTDGSLIVKELLNNNDALELYAILLKDADNEHADANGWVWGYLTASGDVTESATNKGAACISCHSQPGNIDYGLMNKEFP